MPPPRKRSQSPSLSREFSHKSKVTLSNLDDIERKLVALESQLEIVENMIDTGDKVARIKLAQLHGTLEKLLSNQIDRILTGQLVSGKGAVKSRKKQLTLRVIDGRFIYF